MDDNKRTRIGVIALAYGLYCFFSYLSINNFSLLWTVVLIGIAGPLIWAWQTKAWQEMGFVKNGLQKAILLAIIGGILAGSVGLFLLDELFLPDNLGQQLAIGVPMWLLIASPFQELFFRSWMQPILKDTIGKWSGLLISNIAFTVWHYVSPIANASPFPLNTVTGILSVFVAGFIYGYVFEKSNNIIAPWMAHALQGILLIFIGAADFVSAMKT